MSRRVITFRYLFYGLTIWCVSDLTGYAAVFYIDIADAIDRGTHDAEHAGTAFSDLLPLIDDRAYRGMGESSAGKSWTIRRPWSGSRRRTRRGTRQSRQGQGQRRRTWRRPRRRKG